MKILIVPSINLPLPPVKGGAVQNLIDELLKFNEEKAIYEITVCSIYDKNVDDKINTYTKTKFVYLKISSFISKLIKKDYRFFSNKLYKIREHRFINLINKVVSLENYDLILLENTPHFCLKIKSRKSKIALHLHNDWLNNSTKDSEKIVNSLDYILCVSNYIKSRILTIKPTNKIFVVHNGINFNNMVYSYEHRIEIRKKYNISEEDFVLIFSARMVKEKGIDILIHALAMTKSKCKLLVLGSKVYGENIIDPFLLELKKFVYEKNLDQRIIFTGYVPYEDISKYYSAADIGILPSMWDDPFPLTILEYMYIGLPIISTISGGIPEELGDNSGVMLKRDSDLTKNLALEIDKLIEDNDFYNTLKRNAKERSKKNFSIKSYIDRLTNVIDNI